MNDKTTEDIEDTYEKLEQVIETGSLSAIKWANSATEDVESIRESSENYNRKVNEGQASTGDNSETKSKAILNEKK
mgnify:CR=1 FL=1